MKQNVSVEVEKEAYELGVGLVEVVKAVKLALADGFQAGADVPAIVVAAIAKLPPAIEGLDKLGAELAEDPVAFVRSFALAGADVASVFVKKPAVPGVPPAA